MVTNLLLYWSNIEEIFDTESIFFDTESIFYTFMLWTSGCE